jgi:hypothetical protein
MMGYIWLHWLHWRAFSVERSRALHLGQTKLIGLIDVVSDMGFLLCMVELMPDFWGGSIGS